MESGPALSAVKVRKSFGSLVALDDVDFSVRRGEIHGLLGENGAGKSTLMNILYGLYQPTSGEIFIEGNPVKLRSPADSIKLGIGMVHQQSTLVPAFNAVENIVIGTDSRRLDFEEEAKKIQGLSEQYGMGFPLRTRVGELEVGVRQKIEIVRALYRNAKILILDEPTTFLVESEFEQLKTSLRALAGQGLAVILITHKIREVLSSCTVATVLRKGKIQGVLAIQEASKEKLVKLMFLDQSIEVTDSALPKMEMASLDRSEKPVLQFLDVYTKASDRSPGLKGINLEVYGGEILGVAGVSGQKDMAEAIVHPENILRGEILFKGKSIKNFSTVEVFEAGVAYTPEDRVKEAILPSGNIVYNVFLPHHGEKTFRAKGLLVDWEKVVRVSEKVIRDFHVLTPGPKTEIRRLSGGNIQKVILGRALFHPIELLITHNPSSGLDLSTVEFIFKKLLAIRNEGGAVLFLNEDLDELMLISDRIVIIHGGRLMGVRNRAEADKVEIGSLMVEGE